MCPRSCAPQERPPQWEARALQLESSLRSQLLEKSLGSNEDKHSPLFVKEKNKNKKKLVMFCSPILLELSAISLKFRLAQKVLHLIPLLDCWPALTTSYLTPPVSATLNYWHFLTGGLCCIFFFSMPEGMLHFLLCILFSFYCKVMPTLSRLAKVSLRLGGLLWVTTDILSTDNPLSPCWPVQSHLRFSHFFPLSLSFFLNLFFSMYISVDINSWGNV